MWVSLSLPPSSHTLIHLSLHGPLHPTTPSPSPSHTHSYSSQMMRTRGVLQSHKGWNLVLRAVSRLGNVGALITTFNDMQVEGIQPTLSTYHLVIDDLLASQNRKSITGIVFPLWRMVVQDYPRIQPDVDLLNKFIRSCKLSQYYERAFYFLMAMQDYNLAPNLETFKELLDVRKQQILLDSILLYNKWLYKCIYIESPSRH